MEYAYRRRHQEQVIYILITKDLLRLQKVFCVDKLEFIDFLYVLFLPPAARKVRKEKPHGGIGAGLTNKKAASRVFIRLDSPSPVSPNPNGLIKRSVIIRGISFYNINYLFSSAKPTGEGILPGRGCRRTRKCGMFAFSRTRPSPLERRFFGSFLVAADKK